MKIDSRIIRIPLHKSLIQRVRLSYFNVVRLDVFHAVVFFYCIDLFTVINNQLVVVVSDGLDFEQSPSHTMIVRCTDKGTPRLYVEVR